MLSNLLEIFLLIKYPLIGLFFIFAIISFYWDPIFKFLNLKTYNNIQRVHTNEVSRLGGLIIYLFFWSLNLLDLIENKLFFNILISAIPFVLISLKEDLFHNSTPKNRLLLMIISCLIFFYINPVTFPVIDIPFIGRVISLYPVSIIFFTFSILVIMNGTNLIDGLNGLFGFSSFIQLLSIYILAFLVNDTEIKYLIGFFIIPICIFLFFNYPFGKIFAGDLGAYFYGYTNSILVICFFGRHPELLTWYALIILFYPSMELLFSFMRKKFKNVDPFSPDDNHLHSYIYKCLKRRFTKIYANSIATLFYIPLFILILLINYFHQFISFYYLLMILIFFSLLYIFSFIYFVLRFYDHKK
jgi:UDP-GlcNAc:undecaprenyl-phosphate/decaprenyl-phosphate GlcNAc-1-phosphate transferase